MTLEQPSQRNNRRIVVVAGYEWIYTSPSTISAVAMLAEHGYQVELLARPQTRPIDGVVFSHSLIRTTFYPWHDQGWHINLQNAVFTLWVMLSGLRRRPAALLAIDPEALIPCAILSILTGAPLIYFSLEIATWPSRPSLSGNPLRALKRLLGFLSRVFWKWAESLSHRYVKLTIIQDPNRARVLQEVNRLSQMEVVYVQPSLRTTCRFETKPRYLQDKFNLNPDQIVLLCAGGIADDFRLHELARAAYTWPENWVLIIHGHGPIRADNPYNAELIRLCDGRKVLLSGGLLPQKEFDALVASAHIGLAFYKDFGPNHFHITSGKLMQYLRCGLPVVTVDFPNMKDIVEKFGCGVCVKDEKQVAVAVREILSDYEHYSHTAVTVFDEHFRFDRHFTKIIKQVDCWCAG